MRHDILTPLVLIAALGTAAPTLAHEPVSWGGTEFHILLDSEETGGSLGMFKITTKGPGGPGMHIHQDADEVFFVIEGTALFANGDERVTVPAGDAVFVKQGNEHTFRVLDEEGAQLLVVVAPAGFEGFFQAMADADIRLPEDMEKMIEISKGFSQDFTGPPLAAE